MTITNFSKPQHDRYFEDYQVGTTYDLGSIEVEEEEVLSFARRFDPQKMHTDPEAAAAGPFQGLIASGWHTLSLMMRLMVDNYVSTVAGLASPGWMRCVGTNRYAPVTGCPCAPPSLRRARPAPNPIAASFTR